jgi:hypothetical protein
VKKSGTGGNGRQSPPGDRAGIEYLHHSH